MQRQVYVVGAVGTAIGSIGGSLKDVPLTDLATTVIRAVIKQCNMPVEQIGHVVMGNVIPTVPRDAYLSRVASLNAGIPKEVPAFNVNRLCGSGLQAIISAAQAILLGDAEVSIGAGAESMSRGPYISSSQRWGAKMGNSESVDYTLGILNDPFEHTHMGITAENVAARHCITRSMQDELALISHLRAANAIAKGYFASQIVAIELKTRNGNTFFETDEHVRGDITLEGLARLKPAFKKDGVVTAGNSSGINDGASALLSASAEAVRSLDPPCHCSNKSCSGH